MVTFYHCFISQAAQIMRLLYEMLKGKSANQAISWFEESDGAMELANT